MDKGKSIIEMSEIECERTWDDLMENTARSILDEAGQEDHVHLACVILTDVDGKRTLATWTPEYGDGEGVRQEKDFVRRCRRKGLLEEGQSLEVEVRSIRVDMLLRGTATRQEPV